VACIDQATLHGKTALWYSCSGGHCGIVRSLLAKGADPSIADHNGTRAMDMAKHKNDPGCVEALQVRPQLLHGPLFNDHMCTSCLYFSSCFVRLDTLI
jgi:ankyrin repeat protein